MTNPDLTKSLQLWKEYGQFVLMAMPYDDNVIVAANGCTVVDADGNEFLDLTSGQFCAVLGHNHPKLVERLREQGEKVLHTSSNQMSLTVMETAAKLAAVAPGDLKKSLFLSTGSEANECALRIAKTVTKKSGIVGLSQGYYGITLATRNAGIGFGKGPAASPAVPDTFRLLTPYCLRCPVGAKYPDCDFLCLKTSEALLQTQVENVAAFIVEPILSAGGMIVPPEGYVQRLSELARKYDALLIADEAQTGFGRTGKWFGMEQHGVTPDIITICKNAGGGFPVSGVMTTEAVTKKLAARGFYHLSSHQADPLGAAVLGAVIDTIREENLVEQAAQKGQYFKDRLLELKAKWPVIADVRGMGLMLGVEFVKDPATLEPAEDMGRALRRLCFRKGVHLNYTILGQVLRITPPLTITKGQIDYAVTVLDGAIADALSGAHNVEEMAPANPYTQSLLKRSWRRTYANYIEKLWQSSPQQVIRTVRRKMGRE